MTPVKRFGLAVLFAMSVALFIARPALAVDWGTITLTPTSTLPTASGEAALTGVHFAYVWFMWMHPSYVEYYRGDLTVTCHGLTPGRSYSTPVGVFKAGRDGSGTVTGLVEFALFYEAHWDQRGDLIELEFIDWSGLPVDVTSKFGKSKDLVLSGAFPWLGVD